MKKQNVGK